MFHENTFYSPDVIVDFTFFFFNEQYKIDPTVFGIFFFDYDYINIEHRSYYLFCYTIVTIYYNIRLLSYSILLIIGIFHRCRNSIP